MSARAVNLACIYVTALLLSPCNLLCAQTPVAPPVQTHDPFDKDRNPREWAVQQSNIAVQLYERGDYRAVERICREVLPVKTKEYGAAHVPTTDDWRLLGMALLKQGKFVEAEAEYRALLREIQPFRHLRSMPVSDAHRGLGKALNGQGKFVAAETEYRAALKTLEQYIPTDNPAFLDIRHDLAVTLANQGRYADAEKEHRAVLALRERVLSGAHPETLTSLYHLAYCLQKQNKNLDAHMCAQRAAEGRRKRLGANHPDTKAAEKLLQELSQP